MNKEKSKKKARRVALQDSEIPSIQLVAPDSISPDIASTPVPISPLETTHSTPDSTPDSTQTTPTSRASAPGAQKQADTDHQMIGESTVHAYTHAHAGDWTSTGLIGKIEWFRANMDYALFSKESLAKYFAKFFFIDYVKYMWSLRAPLFLLLAIVCSPKVILLWIVIVVLKPLFTLSYQRLPLDVQNKFAQKIPLPVRRSPFLRDLGEGANQSLPFILFWLYLCCAPFAVLWIAGHWLRGFFPSKPRQIKDGFVFGQNKKRDLSQPENNFYYSKIFATVIIAFFALGVPAFLTYSLYQSLGIERDVQKSATTPVINQLSNVPPPARRGNFIGGGHDRASRGEGLFVHELAGLSYDGPEATAVPGYYGYWPYMPNLGRETTSANLFFVHFYLVSLACAITVLFFRAWFFFPLNFLSDEHEVYLTASGVRRSTMKNWFLNVLTINRWAIGGGPDSLDWNEIKSVQHLEEGFTRLSPLPETAFKKTSLAYKLLNKLASFIDGLTSRMNTGNYLVFSTTENKGDFGRNLKINLNDLNREQRARLFYSVKNWAPHVVIKPNAEELLLGSVVLQDVRYTQLWFDLLTSRTKVVRQSTLTPGGALRDGAYVIEERLSAGGQATAYLAKNASGTQVVLKEFILAITSSPGALIESAREFETEVSLLSQLNNPGIVRLEDFFTEDGRVYVVLEYVHGKTLRQRVQQDGPLSEAEVVKITNAVCDVLQYLHNFDPPIVHRDLTPENILVLPDGTIKLIDFSLAVKSDGHSTTDSCGKQAFTPPEQFREEICPQSDIYGLGATMYFMLTGVPPKPITVSSPKTKALQTSDQLNRIVERATQLDLTQRYESVHWLKLDLSAVSAQESQTLTNPRTSG